MAYYSRPEQLLTRFEEIFQANKEMLGIRSIGLQNENLLVEYPALDIASGATVREIHGTHKYLLTFEVSFWIYHANFESTHARRTVEDMELATNVARFLHQPGIRTLEDDSDPGPNKNKIMFGFVSQELPGVLARRERAGILTTRLIWIGQSEVNFDDA